MRTDLLFIYETQKNVLLQSNAVGATIVPETYRYREYLT